MDDLDLNINPIREMGESFNLLMNAKSGRLSHEPQTRMLTLLGDDAAEALANGYHTRDALRDAGYECEAEYVGLCDDQPEWADTDFHEVELHIEGGE